MAEADDTAAPIIDETDVEQTPGFKPPEKKSMTEILSQDTEDESLQKYKASLLGSATPSDAVFDPNDPRKVIVKSMSLVVEGRPDVTLDFTGNLDSLKDQSFTLQEGAKYRLRVNFCVQREIIAGLKLVLKTTRKGIKVDSSSHMIGSYGPKKEEYSFLTPADEAPKGMIARGSYKMACGVMDDDKNYHLQWSFVLNIKKDWD